MTEQQIPKLVGQIVEHQHCFSVLSIEDAQWAIQNTESAISLFVQAIKNRNGAFYLATVDYGLSLAAMIQLGKYDWMNSDITAERFPIKGEGQKNVQFELVHFNRGISSEDAAAEMKKRGLRPARIEELLSFGAKYPELQLQFPIVALGSVAEFGGGQRVAYLYRGDARRYLDLRWWSGGWGARCRFLVVRD